MCVLELVESIRLLAYLYSWMEFVLRIVIGTEFSPLKLSLSRLRSSYFEIGVRTWH